MCAYIYVFKPDKKAAKGGTPREDKGTLEY